MDNQTIALVIAVIIIAILLLLPSFTCEKYSNVNSAKFTVKRPKMDEHYNGGYQNLARMSTGSAPMMPMMPVSAPKASPVAMSVQARPMAKPMMQQPMAKPMMMEQAPMREGFIISPKDYVKNNALTAKADTVKNDNWWIGALPNELNYGVSVAVPATTVSTSTFSVPAQTNDDFWKTVL